MFPLQLVGGFAVHSDLSRVEAIAADAKALDERLKAADRDSVLFNSREALLGQPVTDYTMIKKVIDQFEPFGAFWLTAASWQASHKSWMNDSWEALNGEVVEREVAAAYKTLYKTAKVFTNRDLPKNAENCEAVRQEVEAFKKFVPLVQALRNPGMRDRHWDLLSQQLGFDFHPDK